MTVTRIVKNRRFTGIFQPGNNGGIVHVGFVVVGDDGSIAGRFVGWGVNGADKLK